MDLVFLVRNVARRFRGRMILLMLLLSLIVIGVALVGAAIYNIMNMQSSVGVKPF